MHASYGAHIRNTQLAVDTTSDCICANGTCRATPLHAAASQGDAALLARMFTDDEGFANRCGRPVAVAGMAGTHFSREGFTACILISSLAWQRLRAIQTVECAPRMHRC